MKLSHSPYFAAPGDIARAAAAAPRSTREEKKNRFDLIFPLSAVIFRPAKPRDPLIYSDGTKATGLAEARIEIGDSGLYFGARIVLLEKGSEVKLKCQLPSTGGAFKQVIFKAESDVAENDLAAWCNNVAGAYLVWRKKNGGSSIGPIASNGLSTSLADLGMVMQPAGAPTPE